MTVPECVHCYYKQQEYKRHTHTHTHTQTKNQTHVIRAQFESMKSKVKVNLKQS